MQGPYFLCALLEHSRPKSRGDEIMKNAAAGDRSIQLLDEQELDMFD